MTPRRPASGFTLVELMATILCVSILAAVAIPRISGYILQSRLESAKPYLMQIAARQRMFKIENGVYCCSTAGSGTSEDALAAGLGVTLSDNGDFCFVFICQSTALCQTTSGPGFITAAGGTAPDFEVWAILRDVSGNSAAGPGGVACTASTGKIASTGWAGSSGSTSAGRAGQVVVARYPPPLNGAGSVGSYSPHAGLTFRWTDGISTSDALFP